MTKAAKLVFSGVALVASIGFLLLTQTAFGRRVEPAPRGRPRKQPSTAPSMENTNAQLV